MKYVAYGLILASVVLETLFREMGLWLTAIASLLLFSGVSILIRKKAATALNRPAECEYCRKAAIWGAVAAGLIVCVFYAFARPEIPASTRDPIAIVGLIVVVIAFIFVGRYVACHTKANYKPPLIR